MSDPAAWGTLQRDCVLALWRLGADCDEIAERLRSQMRFRDMASLVSEADVQRVLWHAMDAGLTRRNRDHRAERAR